MKEYLRLFCGDFKDDWPRVLPGFTMTHNTSLNRRTGSTPQLLVTGVSRDVGSLAGFVMAKGDTSKVRYEALEALVDSIPEYTLQRVEEDDAPDSRTVEVGDLILVDRRARVTKERVYANVPEKLLPVFHGPYQVAAIKGSTVF